MQLKPDDRRLREERFQNGHAIGSCWGTVARWMTLRAQRGAGVLKKPLFLAQAADRSAPTMQEGRRQDDDCASPKKPGGMHGLLPVH
eukprot:6882472-Pyramimonas_sp.AAC.1